MYLQLGAPHSTQPLPQFLMGMILTILKSFLLLSFSGKDLGLKYSSVLKSIFTDNFRTHIYGHVDRVTTSVLVYQVTLVPLHVPGRCHGGQNLLTC